MRPARKLAAFVGFLLILAVVGGCASAPTSRAVGAPEQTKVVMAVGGAECICYLPAVLAYEQGYFKAEGITVDLQDLKGGSKALEALVAGSADIVSGGYEHTLRMQTKGKAMQLFVTFAKTPGLVLMIPTKNAGKIKSVKDLRGLMVGVSAPGSTTHEFINYLLIKEGLQPTDVKIVGIGLGGTAVAAVERGAVDAAVLLDPAVTQLVKRGSATVLVDTRPEAETRKIFGGDFILGGLYSNAAFVQANPNTVQHTTNAIARALTFMSTHTPEEIANVVPENYYGGDKATYTEALRAAQSGFATSGLMPKGVPETTLEMLSLSDDAVRSVKEKVNLAATFTDAFVQKVPK